MLKNADVKFSFRLFLGLMVVLFSINTVTAENEKKGEMEKRPLSKSKHLKKVNSPKNTNRYIVLGSFKSTELAMEFMKKKSSPDVKLGYVKTYAIGLKWRIVIKESDIKSKNSVNVFLKNKGFFNFWKIELNNYGVSYDLIKLEKIKANDSLYIGNDPRFANNNSRSKSKLIVLRVLPRINSKKGKPTLTDSSLTLTNDLRLIRKSVTVPIVTSQNSNEPILLRPAIELNPDFLNGAHGTIALDEQPHRLIKKAEVENTTAEETQIEKFIVNSYQIKSGIAYTSGSSPSDFYKRIANQIENNEGCDKVIELQNPEIPNRREDYFSVNEDNEVCRVMYIFKG